MTIWDDAKDQLGIEVTNHSLLRDKVNCIGDKFDVEVNAIGMFSKYVDNELVIMKLVSCITEIQVFLHKDPDYKEKIYPDNLLPVARVKITKTGCTEEWYGRTKQIVLNLMDKKFQSNLIKLHEEILNDYKNQ